jgi:hypothetical protein
VSDPQDYFRDLIAKIEKVKPHEVPSEPDEGFTQEKAYLEHQQVLIQLQSEIQDIRERKKYALWFVVLACAWVSIIAILLFFQGFGSLVGFRISDSVLLAAIGSTTMNIVGVLYVVAYYLFPKRGS